MLELKNICFEVEDEKKGILKDVSLKIDSGKFVVITGPNGGGKSTLARIISGILTPTSGQILFDGQDITGRCVEETGVSVHICTRVKIQFNDAKG